MKETGVGDYHAFIFSFLKTTLPKCHQIEQLPEKITYTKWEKDFVKTLNERALLKAKVIRGNHKSFITKNLRKTILKRSSLKKRANISNNPEIIKLYKKQRNYVVNLSRKVKK